MQPLGIELRYAVLEHDTYGQSSITDAISGSLYLLHPPEPDVFIDALRVLLIEFCNNDIAKSNEPSWIDSIKPPRGEELDKQIAEITSQTDGLIEERDKLLAERKSLEYWRLLLYETGDQLEEVVKKSLELLGIANIRKGSKDNYDLVGEYDGKEILFEVKGLNGSAGRKHVFDLDRHIDEYETKNKDIKISKGILISNSFRNEPPNIRDKGGREIFAADAISHASLLDLALLDTRVIFNAISDILAGKELDTNQFLQNLIKTVGVFSLK